VYECAVAQPWQATARSPSSSSSSSSPHGFVVRFASFCLCLSLTLSLSGCLSLTSCSHLSHTHTDEHERTDGRTVVDGDRVGCSTIHSDNANAIAQLTSTTQSNNNAAATALPLNFLSYSILLLLLLARHATSHRSSRIEHRADVSDRIKSIEHCSDDQPSKSSSPLSSWSGRNRFQLFVCVSDCRLEIKTAKKKKKKKWNGGEYKYRIGYGTVERSKRLHDTHRAGRSSAGAGLSLPFYSQSLRRVLSSDTIDSQLP